MLFNSAVFLFAFLPVVLAAYLLLERHSRAGFSIGFLAVASLFFYAWWNPRYLPLLILSIVFNFTVGLLLPPESKTRGRRALLIFGIAVNLALLGGFKYTGFVIYTANEVAGLHLPGFDIVLPLAISFFTFQQIAFLVDSYEGKAPERSFPAYCMFITFFPHLIAGPIVHHKEMMPQFARLYAGAPRRTDELWQDVAVGFALFAIGLGKKVLFADQFGSWATNAFRAVDSGATLSLVEAWLGVTCFALQIYLDFSGYSDMAIGLARMFGVKLPVNFNSPYKATSIIDFWRRWHMTLSRFLRDYLYIPLGGNRRGGAARMVNILVVMLLGGLWHGAAWTFVAWGGLHGLFIVINHGYRALAQRGAPRVPPLVGGALTFVCVLVAWVFFRAETFSGAVSMIGSMFGREGIAVPMHWLPVAGAAVEALAQWGISVEFRAMRAYSGGTQLAWVAIALLAMWLLPNSQEIMRRFDPIFEKVPAPAGLAARLVWRPSVASALVCAVVMLWATFVVLQGAPGEFIYFQF